MFYPRVEIEEAVNGYIVTTYSACDVTKDVYEQLSDAAKSALKAFKKLPLKPQYDDGTCDNTLE
jgi:hypothetical protein